MATGWGTAILLEDGTPLLLEDGTPLLEEWSPLLADAQIGIGARIVSTGVELHTEPCLVRFAIAVSATGHQTEVKGTTVGVLYAGPSVYILHGKKAVQAVVAMAAGPSAAVAAAKAVRWAFPVPGGVDVYSAHRKEMEVACPVELPIAVVLAAGVKGGATQSAAAPVGLSAAVPVGTKAIPVAVPTAVEIPIGAVTGGAKTQVAAVPVELPLTASLHGSILEGENNKGAPVLAATAGLNVSIAQGAHDAVSQAAPALGLSVTAPAVMGALGLVAAAVDTMAAAVAFASDRDGALAPDVGGLSASVVGHKDIPAASPTSAEIAVYAEHTLNPERFGAFRCEIAIGASVRPSHRTLGGVRITYGKRAGVRVLVGSG